MIAAVNVGDSEYMLIYGECGVVLSRGNNLSTNILVATNACT